MSEDRLHEIKRIAGKTSLDTGIYLSAARDGAQIHINDASFDMRFANVNSMSGRPGR
jgi:hypothetical protein